jgi:hypothetical protein
VIIGGVFYIVNDCQIRLIANAYRYYPQTSESLKHITSCQVTSDDYKKDILQLVDNLTIKIIETLNEKAPDYQLAQINDTLFTQQPNISEVVVAELDKAKQMHQYFGGLNKDRPVLIAGLSQRDLSINNNELFEDSIDTEKKLEEVDKAEESKAKDVTKEGKSQAEPQKSIAGSATPTDSAPGKNTGSVNKKSKPEEPVLRRQKQNASGNKLIDILRKVYEDIQQSEEKGK